MQSLRQESFSWTLLRRPSYPRSVLPFPARFASVLTFALSFGVTSCIPSIKSVFVDMSYPDDPPQSAVRDLSLSVDSAITPALLVGYPHPLEVGGCLEQLASGESEIATAMWRYGSCM